MALSLDSVGYRTRSHYLEYDWKTTALYALGIGAQDDELDYLYEARGPKVFPSFAVVPAYPVLTELIETLAGDASLMVHSAQAVKCHRAIPPSGSLETVGQIHALYDMKRMAMAVLTTETRIDGAPLMSTEWTLLYRGDGGFGGPRRPKPVLHRPEAGEHPDIQHEETTAPTQALLYRLSGDLNPLHADPAFASAAGFERPILHGLATFGYACRAIVRGVCGGDPARLRALSAQFTKPVLPGDTLRFASYAPRPSDDGALYVPFSAESDGAKGAIFSGGLATIVG